MNAADASSEECRLIAAARRGDRGALDMLAAMYAQKVYAFCARIAGSFQEAEDLSQDVLLRAFASLRRYRGGCSFSTWLYTIALNRWRTIVRDRHLPPESLDTTAGEDATGAPLRQWTDPGPSVERGAEAAENAVRVHQALVRLPVEQRTVIVLQHLYGYRLREIARLTRTKIGTVSARAVRGMRALARLLKESEGPESRG